MASMEFEERMRAVRWVFQFLGAACCTLFVVQGVVIFFNHQAVFDFWETCHWLSEGVLCVVVGLGGFIFEVRSCVFSGVLTSFLRNAKYRIGLGLVYIWMGCYSSGGRIATAGDGWGTLGRITGIVVWVVAVANFTLSMFAEHEELPANGSPESDKSTGGGDQMSNASEQQWATGPSTGNSTTAVPKQWATSGDPMPTSSFSAGSPPRAGASPIGHGQPSPAAPAAAPATEPLAVAPPPGGWNTFGSKPFGSQ